jgi:hypothetical protein
VANQKHIQASIKVLGDTKPDCAKLPSNNDNEGNTIIHNSSGLGQDMARNTPTLNNSHCNPEKRTYQPQGRKGVEKLNTKTGCKTNAQSSELANQNHKFPQRARPKTQADRACLFCDLTNKLMHRLHTTKYIHFFFSKMPTV